MFDCVYVIWNITLSPVDRHSMFEGHQNNQGKNMLTKKHFVNKKNTENKFIFKNDSLIL